MPLTAQSSIIDITYANVTTMNEKVPQNRNRDNKQPHWMSRMLAPQSIALVGASETVGSFGLRSKHLLENHAYAGSLYLVNPRYQQIEGMTCYPNIESLPTVPDLVILVIGSHAVEAIFDKAINLGVGGIVIYVNNYLEEETTPSLLQRLKTKASKANIPVCGGNGMGFYNYDTNTLVSFDFPPERPAGHIAFIAHSGSVMTYLANTDPRLMFNLAVSPGQEIHGTVADYMLYALAQPSTRVLAIFVETIRDPARFMLALKSAREKQIPVVVVKVGCTEKSARMAASHSGAVAGNDGAFQGICHHYGAIRVTDMDQLAATALAFSQPRRPLKGDLSSLLDSGGLREQMVDIGETMGLKFTQLTEHSRKQLTKFLEYGLVAENPVDAMGALNADVAEIYRNCLNILAEDPGTAMISLEFEFRDNFSQYPALLDVAKAFVALTDKPLIVVNSSVNANNAATAKALGQLGIPVINGVSLALSAIVNMFRYRDHVFFESPIIQNGDNHFDNKKVAYWRGQLQNTQALGEVESLQLLADFNFPCVQSRVSDNLDDTVAAAEALGYPLVLKSAQPNLHHKSDADGVRLSLMDSAAVAHAYHDIASRLGARVMVATMIETGVELAFGMINDPQFGVVVMVCAGGIYIELLEDRRFIPAPCGVEEAMYNIQSLNIFKILQGTRGRPPCRVDLAAQLLCDFSKLAFELRDVISEIDLNPVIVSPTSCTIVDALVISSRTPSANA